ncbi:hypothetical protein [Rhodopseudomonas palustris]|uniref:hypothetical protein n=1 Tax=Rhodopseudomonas palustris TaxID=1076 RepID=UPI0021F2969C|nr:hypothetical protein [Rhodopseudomonas palustris]UYO52945.1 hypothetical protein KQX61_20470 [Rhodopseudomonas palustris]
MLDIPSYLSRGERARLFPVLADTSKEGRTASILLACLANVDEFGRSMMNTVGQRAGPRTRIETFTEVCFSSQSDKMRPDGLIVLTTGNRQWRALVEAKVGNSELEVGQVESYLALARENDIDALITISNQFAAVPAVHPLQVSVSARRKIELFHWSWMHVLTEASLLLANDEILDRDQRFVLNEMVRFLTHPSAGVKGFDQMPACWTDLVASVQAGAAPSPNSAVTREIVGAWHQVVRDLSLTMSRQLGVEVSPRIPREHLRDLDARAKADSCHLCEEHSLAATLIVPDAASPLEVTADIKTRSLAVSMHLRAPDDKKGTKARLNWLLRQFPPTTNENWHIRLYWPGRTSSTQRPLAALRENVDQAVDEKAGQVVTSFDVIMVRDIGARFAQRKNFIAELEAIVPLAYDQAGQHLRAWQRTAPRLPEAKAEPASVNTEAMRDAAEQELTGPQERPVLAQPIVLKSEPDVDVPQDGLLTKPPPEDAAGPVGPDLAGQVP